MKNVGGRPSGSIKTAKIEISIEPKVKDTFMSIVHDEGKTASGKLGEWIRDYINEKERQEI